MLVGGSHLPGGVVVEVTQETGAGTHCVRHGAVQVKLIVVAVIQTHVVVIEIRDHVARIRIQLQALVEIPQGPQADMRRHVEALGVVTGRILPVAARKFKSAQVELITLSNYNAMLETALETNYIKPEDLETLQEWRKDPASWQGPNNNTPSV
mgnify:CR=1 FL=1